MVSAVTLLVEGSRKRSHNPKGAPTNGPRHKAGVTKKYWKVTRRAGYRPNAASNRSNCDSTGCAASSIGASTNILVSR